jgi:hypothetical protein
MQTATLVIAVVGVALATLSLGWQAATFLLSGPRVKVFLAQGYRGPGGVMLAPIETYSDGGAAIARMGFTEHVLAVHAVNRGRLPASITNWTVRFSNGATYMNPTDTLNPKLPYRLEAHADATWYAPAAFLQEAQKGFADGSDGAARARGEVSLASREKSVRSRYSLIIRAEGVRQRHSRSTRCWAWIRRKPLL